MPKLTKLSLSVAVAATFTATVQVPIPGGEFAPVVMTFKYRDRDAFQEFLDSLKVAKDVEAILDTASGWDLDDDFNSESVEKLCKRYMGAAGAILHTYINELTGARVKN
jgi:hypothetical protein